MGNIGEGFNNINYKKLIEGYEKKENKEVAEEN